MRIDLHNPAIRVKFVERIFHAEHARVGIQLAHDARGFAFEDNGGLSLYMGIAAKLYSSLLDTASVSYPADWWQAVKERWFPKWAISRWPVRYTTKTFEAKQYLPSCIKVSPGDCVVKLTEVRSGTD